MPLIANFSLLEPALLPLVACMFPKAALVFFPILKIEQWPQFRLGVPPLEALQGHCSELDGVEFHHFLMMKFHP